MTLKEYMKIHHPEMIDEIAYNGGVFSCPHKHKDFDHMDLTSDEIGCNKFSSCADCWSQEYIPKEEDMGTKEYIDERKNECFNACEKLENTVWDFAREIADMPADEKKECFGFFNFFEVLSDLSYEEAKEKYDTYMENKIKVGDEITDGEETGYVLWINDEECLVKLDSYDFPQSISNLKNFRKTGRHYEQLAQIMDSIS